MADELREKREIELSEARDKYFKILASIIPFGTAAYELITTVIVPLHEQKRVSFLYDIAERLKILENKNELDFNDLAQNEEFNSIITKATLMAQQNHQKIKMEAFKAIVINSSINLSKNETMYDWAHRFLYLVDRFSPFHILLLKTFRSPLKAVEDEGVNLRGESNMSSKELFFLIFSMFKDRTMLIEQCWKELKDDGLVNKTFDEIIHKQDSFVKLTTDFGDKFLDMIEIDEL